MFSKTLQRRLPSLKKIMIRQSIAIGLIIMVMAFVTLSETTDISRHIYAELDQLQKELTSSQQRYSAHIAWNNLTHQISLDTQNFLLEFELLTLDPERNDKHIGVLVARMKQHHQSLQRITVPDSQSDNVENLKKGIWTLEGIGHEILDNISTNSRMQLHRDSIEFVDAITSNTLAINAETITLSDSLKQRIDTIVEQSLENQQRLKQLIDRHNLIIIAISTLCFSIVLLAFIFLFKRLSERIRLLEQYSIDIAEQKFKRPPFSSKDITGHLAVRMGLMARTIRKGLASMQNSSREIVELAYYDTLTGLENRRLFNENLEQAVLLSRRYQENYALVYLDLDLFKAINDRYGHEAGDKVLVRVARRLHLTLREEDHIARLGGDEFAMLFRSDNTDISNLMERILKALQEPILDSQYELRISASIGIAILGVDADNLSDIMRYADMALYKAKESGRNRYHYFSEQLEATALKKHKLLKRLANAIENDELELFYQTQHDMTNRRVTGVEALIRWPQPEGGFIYPDEFIPLAEESSLIITLGDWIIDRACRDGQQLNKLAGPLTIAINLSTRQFEDPEMMNKIINRCRSYNLPHNLVELEITESLLLDDMENGETMLKGMMNEGFRISLDDFGTGYSSLFYLKNLPVTSIKIDRSFTSGLPSEEKDAAIVETSILLAHRLKLDVIAEGIETEEQLEYLQQSGCNTAQGYLLGKPQPLSTLIQLLQQQTICACSAVSE